MFAKVIEDLEEEAVGDLAIQVLLTIRLPEVPDDRARLSRSVLDPRDLGEGGLGGAVERREVVTVDEGCPDLRLQVAGLDCIEPLTAVYALGHANRDAIVLSDLTPLTITHTR